MNAGTNEGIITQFSTTSFSPSSPSCSQRPASPLLEGTLSTSPTTFSHPEVSSIMATEPDIPTQPTSAFPQVIPSQPSSTFPQDLPPRPDAMPKRSFKDRNCPNMRTCWHFSLASYNPLHCPDKRTLFRRLAIIFIILFRTAMSALVLSDAIWAMDIAAIVLYIILGIIGFWFIAWCLAEIGEAKGERRVLGKLIVGRHIYITY